MSTTVTGTTTTGSIIALTTGIFLGIGVSHFLGLSSATSTTTTTTSSTTSSSSSSTHDTPQRKTQKLLTATATLPLATPDPRNTSKLALNSPNNLSGKVVVVVGAQSKVGIAVCRAVHSAGAKVVMADARLEALKKICETLNNGYGDDSPASRIHAPPKTASVVMVDITNASSMKRLVTKATEVFNQVDIVVNCAGYQGRSPMKECNETEWSTTMNVNCTGMLHVFGAFLPTMLEQQSGQIISVSSEPTGGIDTDTGLPTLTVYGASKQFVETLSTGTNNELSEYGIRVTTVRAGRCADAATETTTSEEFSNPADVADAVLFAASTDVDVKAVTVATR